MASFVTQHDDILVFQDTLDNNSDDVSSAFFELANASRIAYRVARRRKRKQDKNKAGANDNNLQLIIQQDFLACLQHTGGIIWETSYLLLGYLSNLKKSLGRLLEVGAGCGLLGQGLAVCSDCVVLTECEEAFGNLQRNVPFNRETLQAIAAKTAVDCCVLNWLHVDRDVESNALLQVRFDTIVGTDVLFSPKLVRPLLQTLQRLSHEKSTIYLCVQIRCAASHAMLLEEAGEYNFTVSEISDEVYDDDGLRWGKEMDCLVLRLTHRAKRKRDDDVAAIEVND